MANTYLLVYNSVSLLLWLLVASNPLNNVSNSYVLFTQSFAVLEIFHSLIGLVSSPVSTVAVQVASRLLLCLVLPSITPSIFRYSMLFAWSLTEVIRYSYYAFTNPPYVLLWARYSLFIVLYPLGAGSEVAIMYLFVLHSSAFWSRVLVGSIMLLYPPGFYMLYSYMFKQRLKYLYPSSLKKSSKKNK